MKHNPSLANRNQKRDTRVRVRLIANQQAENCVLGHLSLRPLHSLDLQCTCRAGCCRCYRQPVSDGWLAPMCTNGSSPQLRPNALGTSALHQAAPCGRLYPIFHRAASEGTYSQARSCSHRQSTICRNGNGERGSGDSTGKIKLGIAADTVTPKFKQHTL